MPKVTITIEDLPAGDPNGDFRATVDFEPSTTNGQQLGQEPLTTAQQVGAHMAGVLRQMINPPAATNGHNHHADVIELAPAKDGTLAQVTELKEGGQ